MTPAGLPQGPSPSEEDKFIYATLADLVFRALAVDSAGSCGSLRVFCLRSTSCCSSCLLSLLPTTCTLCH